MADLFDELGNGGDLFDELNVTGPSARVLPTNPPGNLGGQAAPDLFNFHAPPPPPDNTSFLDIARRSIGRADAGAAASFGTAMQWLGNRLGIPQLAQHGQETSELNRQRAAQFPSAFQGQNVLRDLEPGAFGEALTQAAPTGVGPLGPAAAIGQLAQRFVNPDVALDPRFLVESGVEAGTSMVAPLGAAKVIGTAAQGLPKVAPFLAAGGAALTGGIMEGANTYEEILRRTGNEELAARAGESMAAGSAMLNALPFHKILNPSARGIIYNFVTRGFLEGVTEGAEEPLEEIIIGLTTDTPIDWEKAAQQAAQVFPGALLAGGIAGGGNVRAPDPPFTREQFDDFTARGFEAPPGGNVPREAAPQLEIQPPAQPAQAPRAPDLLDELTGAQPAAPVTGDLRPSEEAGGFPPGFLPQAEIPAPATRDIAPTTEQIRALEAEGLGVKRADLPQVRRENQPAYFAWLRDQGVQVTQTEIPPAQLRPIQSELDRGKVAAMAQVLASGRPLGQGGTLEQGQGQTPNIVSSDGFILDGHHRWAAHRLTAADTPIPVIQVGLPAQELLTQTRAFIERGETIAPAPVTETDQGATTSIFTPGNEEITVRYEVVEAADLITSHTASGAVNPAFPADRQPRQRDRKASQLQIQDIARNLNPALLGASPTVTDGAPVVDQSNIVESGNARTLALDLAYRHGRGDVMRQFLIDNASSFGLDPAAIEAKSAPVLVRRRISSVADAAGFARQANVSTIAQFSPTEQAALDAQRISDEDLSTFVPDEAGNVLAKSNDRFMRAFIGNLPPTESASLLTADGRINKVAADRVRAAVFKKAYGSDELVSLIAEEADPDFRNILNGLQRAAPAFARARGLAGGDLGDMDVIAPLIEAIDLIRQSRQKNLSLGDMVRQGGLFGALDPAVIDIATIFDVNIRSARRISEFISSLGQAVEQEITGRQSGSLFEAPIDAGDTISATRQIFEKRTQAPAQADIVTEAETTGARFRRSGEPAAGRRTEAETTGPQFARKLGDDRIPQPLPDNHPLLQYTHTKTGREDLHEQIINDFVRQAKKGDKTVYLTGGGGAAGKGTILKNLQNHGLVPNTVVVDPDLIKPRIPEYDQLLENGDGRAADVVHEESSEIAAQAIVRLTEKGRSFIVDKTFGNEEKGLALISQLKDAGYEVVMLGTTVDVEVAIERAIERGNKENRFVNPDALRRAHRGFSAAWPAYMEEVDQAFLIDNNASGFRAELIAEKKLPGRIQILNQTRYTAFLEKADAERDQRKAAARAAAPAQAQGAPDQAQAFTRPSVVSNQRLTVERWIAPIQKNIGIPVDIIEAPADVPTDAVGVFDPVSGNIELYHDRLRSKDQAQKTYIHEAVGHLGVQALFPNRSSFVTAMMDVFESNEAAVKKIANEFDVTVVVAAEEFVAEQSERYTNATRIPEWFNKLLVRVRNALRRLGVNIKRWGKPEIIDLLTRAKARAATVASRDVKVRKAVRAQPVAAKREGASFKKSEIDQATITDSRAFREWYGDSVLTETGKPNDAPIPVFHGTIYGFEAFYWGELGFHVATDPRGANVAVALSIKRKDKSFPAIGSVDIWYNDIKERYELWVGDLFYGDYRDEGDAINDADIILARESSDRIPDTYKGGAPRIIPLYAKIEKPLRLPDMMTWDDYRSWVRGLHDSKAFDYEMRAERPGEREEFEEQIRAEFFSFPEGGALYDELIKKTTEAGEIYKEMRDDGDVVEAARVDTNQIFSGWIKDTLQKHGFDGIVYENTQESRGADSYIVFEPTQLKSAIANTGKFDPQEKDFLLRRLTKKEGKAGATRKRSDTRADKLEQLADNMEDQIQGKLNPAVGEQNPTARRARIAASMWADGVNLQKDQAALRAMAARIRQGSLNPLLDRFATKAGIKKLRIAAEYDHTWPTAKPDYADWQRQNVKESQAEWKKHGITNGRSYQAAKRAYNDLQVTPVEDEEAVRRKAIKDKETALIGRKIPGWFPTPEAVVRDMLDQADIQGNMDVLEPSAGNGAISDLIREMAPDANLMNYEINQELADILTAKGHLVYQGDFLKKHGNWDRIIMNPPFERGQDVEHVQHAFELLRPGGKVVALMSEHTFFAGDKTAVAGREWLEENDATVVELPDKAFMDAKLRVTGVKARMVTLDKPQTIDREALQEKGQLDLRFRRVRKQRASIGPRRWERGEAMWQKLAEKAVPILDRVGLAKNVTDEYRFMVRAMRAEIMKKARQANEIADPARKLTPVEKELISDYIENELQAGVVPPQNVIDIAAQMSAALEAQSEELIDLEMLDRRDVERWRGKYIPRFYAKPGEGVPKRLYRMFLRIDGAHFKGRGQFEFVEKQDIPMWRSMGWEIRHPEEDTQTVIDGMRDTDKVLMWADYTPSQRQDMGEIRDGLYRFTRGYMETAKDIAVGRLFKTISMTPNLSSPRQIYEDQVQVPDTKIPGSRTYRYGALHGRWVDKTVMADLEIVRYPNPDNPLHRQYMHLLSLWKEGKTALNPVVHGNNVWSQWIMADLYGISALNGKAYYETFKDYNNRGQYYTEAIDNGLFGTEFYGTEIRQQLPEIGEFRDIEAAAAGKLKKLTNYLAKYTGARAYRDAMGRWYQAEDQFYKLLIYRDMRKRGASINKSIDEAERWIFNYADIPKTVRFIKNAPIGLPFFSYTFKAAPTLLYAAMTRPHKFVKWWALFAGANWLAYNALFGPDHEEDEETERKLLPEYMRGVTPFMTHKAMRWPFDLRLGTATFLDLSRRWPLGDLFDINNQIGGVGIMQPLMPNNPVFTMSLAFFANKDSFTGREIVRDTDDFEEKLTRYLEWFTHQVLPNSPLLPYSYSFDKVMRGVAHSVGASPEKPIKLIPMREYTGFDYWGRPQDLTRALLSSVAGWKLREVDLDRESIRQKMKLGGQLRDLRSQAKWIGRDQTISPSTRDAKLRQLRAKVDKIRDKLIEVPNAP